MHGTSVAVYNLIPVVQYLGYIKCSRPRAGERERTIDPTNVYDGCMTRTNASSIVLLYLFSIYLSRNLIGEGCFTDKNNILQVIYFNIFLQNNYISII